MCIRDRCNRYRTDIFARGVWRKLWKHCNVKDIGAFGSPSVSLERFSQDSLDLNYKNLGGYVAKHLEKQPNGSADQKPISRPLGCFKIGQCKSSKD